MRSSDPPASPSTSVNSYQVQKICLLVALVIFVAFQVFTSASILPKDVPQFFGLDQPFGSNSSPSFPQSVSEMFRFYSEGGREFTGYMEISMHERLQRALSPVDWKTFLHMKVLNSENGSSHLDMTRNFPRVEDFIKGTASKVKRSTVGEGGKDRSTATDEESGRKRKEPLNVVLFYADDWTMKVLGALNPHVQTPNIDEMAKNGVLFTHNCVTSSICWISRATLATGVYAAVHRQVKIWSQAIFNGTVQWPQTLYPLLRKHGYYTGIVGKWHAPTPRKFMEYTFDVMKIYSGLHWFTQNGTDRHVTDMNKEDALAFLRQRPKEKKFALTVSFFATHAVDKTPHYPYQPMPESMSLYANDTIPKPKTATEDHWKALPWFFVDKNEARRRWKGRFDTEENYQEKIKNLYRLATEVDAVVGDVIKELKNQGVYNQTLLVFTTDNGNLHGEHGLAEKWYPWEESIRVPLVIQDPRMPTSHRGTVNKDFTLSVDLAPTILSAAKIPIPDFMQGRDIAQLYLSPVEAASSWRQDFFYEWNQVYTLFV
mmetsp:Transcript_55705/g.135001  ORF Transcript_55705/g.135001 Transcript_55705/m.135001 type:complete len:542 (+) Transcript_55705:405-2030(+)